MTSRYALYEIDKLRDRFAPASGVPKGVKPHYNISPAQSVPVILNRDGVPQIELMKWGFIPSSAKDMNGIFRYKTFNARSEAVFEKPTWSSAIRSQRCLIPANGFYEWKITDSGKTPFYIQPNDQALFAFAGLYSTWTDPEGIVWGTCSIVTTESDTQSNMIPSRLPIIVYPRNEAAWLDITKSDANSLYEIMRPSDPNDLLIVPVSDDINSAKIDKPHLITRIVKNG